MDTTIDFSALTPEQLAAAQKEVERRAAAKKKDTSVEYSDDIASLSPELRNAIQKDVSEAVTTAYKAEVENRQKLLGESSHESRAKVETSVQKAYQAREREQEENRIIAKFFRGVKQNNQSEISEAFDAEQKYLGRDTNRLKEAMETRAMGAATAGDELVPEIFETRVIDNIERLGLVRRNARRIPMGSDTVQIPKITGGLTAYEVSAGSQITASDLTTAQLTLAARKLATITAIQNELILNANPTVVPLVIEHAAVALASKEDDLALTGSGSTVSGVLESTTNNRYLGDSSTSGNTSISDITFDDLSRLIDELDDQYIDEGAAFYFHKKVLFHLSTLQITNNYAWAPAAAGQPRTIRGYPYFTSSQMPSAPAVDTAFAFFGNLNHLYMGDRQRMTVTIGREGVVGSDNMFEKDMSGVRVTEHVEFEISDDEAFAILDTAAS